MQNTPRESKGRIAISNADLIYNRPLVFPFNFPAFIPCYNFPLISSIFSYPHG